MLNKKSVDILWLYAKTFLWITDEEVESERDAFLSVEVWVSGWY